MSFLTIIPINIKNYDDSPYKSLPFFPIVGLFIGVFLFLFLKLGEIFLSSLFVSFLVLIAYFVITGGMHFDALADCVDGIFARKGREKTLEIMADPNMGSYALIVMIFHVLLLRHLIYFFIDIRFYFPIIIFPVVGKFAQIFSCVSFLPAKNTGMGKDFIGPADLNILIKGIFVFMLAILPILFLLGVIGDYRRPVLIVTAILMSLSVSNIFAIYMNKKLKGITGDVLGASCEISQIAYLFFQMVLLTNL